MAFSLFAVGIMAGCNGDDGRGPALDEGTYNLFMEGSYQVEAEIKQAARFRTGNRSDQNRLPEGYDHRDDEVLWIQLTGPSTPLVDSLIIGIFQKNSRVQEGTYAVQSTDSVDLSTFKDRTLVYLWLDNQAQAIGAQHGTIDLDRVTGNSVDGVMRDLQFAQEGRYRDTITFTVEGKFEAIPEPKLVPKATSMIRLSLKNPLSKGLSISRKNQIAGRNSPLPKGITLVMIRAM